MLVFDMVALPVFGSGLGLILFDTAYFVWIASELFGAVLVPKLRQRGATRVKRDRGSGPLIIFTVFVSIILAFTFGYAGVGQLPDWAFYLGIFLMFLGVAVRQWAIVVLGRFFSLTVQVAADHKVVDKGPYRLIRHPSYTGVLITFIGLGLAVQSWAALLVLLGVYTLSFGYRMRIEEKTLLSQLGNDYASYMKRTKRLVPYLV
jgi:protein-S-isoprenylcysteine O-methyltransferase Ste14